MDNYEDIIGLPHPEPRGRARMAAGKRATQFLPFAALSGYGEALEETSRQTEDRKELAEDALEQLDRRLSRLKKGMRVRMLCFAEDEKKPGGRKETVEGVFCGVDREEKAILLCDGRKIPLENVLDMA